MAPIERITTDMTDDSMEEDCSAAASKKAHLPVFCWVGSVPVGSLLECGSHGILWVRITGLPDTNPWSHVI